MNVCSSHVIRMPHVKILWETSTVLAATDLMGMDSTAQVTKVPFTSIRNCMSSVIFHIFIDIDECAAEIDECHTNAGCTDTVGSYNCACHVGYTGDGFNCTGNKG